MRSMRNFSAIFRALFVVLALVAAGCTSESATTTEVPTTPTSEATTQPDTTEEEVTTSEAEPTTSIETTTEPTDPPPPVYEPFDVLAFGDAADCREPAANVAELVAETPGDVLIVGDLAYPAGSQADFDNCFLPLYGPTMDRIRSVPGDNDYDTAEGAAYFATMGVERAGNPDEGWWTYTNQGWQIFGLNSACSKVKFCGPNSPQYAFVADAIAQEPDKCRMVVWHQPRFTSSKNYDGLKNMGDLYQLLYDNGADILVVGNSHHYERFEQLNPEGQPDSSGIANFTVGTGGAPYTEFGDPLPGSAIRNNQSRGVVKFTLDNDNYSWEFLNVEGDLEDSGTLPCHNRS